MDLSKYVIWQEMNWIQRIRFIFILATIFVLGVIISQHTNKIRMQQNGITIIETKLKNTIVDIKYENPDIILTIDSQQQYKFLAREIIDGRRGKYLYQIAVPGDSIFKEKGSKQITIKTKNNETRLFGILDL